VSLSCGIVVNKYKILFYVVLAVYVYVYLIGDEVDESGGGIIVNWSSTYV